MPTKKPRMMLTVPQELFDALAEFREATGTSPASFVTGMLLEALPMIRSVTQAAQLAKQGNVEAFEVLSSTLADALHEGTGVQRELMAEHKVRRAAGTPKARQTKEDRKLADAEKMAESLEDAEFAAAYADMLQAADDEKQAREELRQAVTKRIGTARK
jgi:hypothetical protein